MSLEKSDKNRGGVYARAKFCPNIVLKSVSGWVGVWVYAIANFCSTLF